MYRQFPGVFVIVTWCLIAMVTARQGLAQTRESVTRETWCPPAPQIGPRGVSPTQAPLGSVQVNLDASGLNVLYDAANEPTIAIDPTNPQRMVICWRQFDTIDYGFRQAGFAYSSDGGQTWTNGGVIDPGQFRSDPVLSAGPNGDFYFCSLKIDDQGLLSNDLFVSHDGGVTWTLRSTPGGGDKPWMIADQTAGPFGGTIYFDSNQGGSARSIDGGFNWLSTFGFTGLGTMAIGPGGQFYCGGGFSGTFYISRSTDGGETFYFNEVNMGGIIRSFTGPNPEGLLGQASISADPLNASRVYMLCSVDGVGADPLDVKFARSVNGGITWEPPIRVNDDPSTAENWQWFGTMSVAPNGRVDAIWNDSRNSLTEDNCQLYYAFSVDAGSTWSQNRPLTPVWNSFVGWPTQAKIGDYYHMLSDNDGANLAYAATFNGEQDVYFTRILWNDCNRNGVADDVELAGGMHDCNGNGMLDECEESPMRDCNGNHVPDFCDILGGLPDCNDNDVPDECEPDLCGPLPNPMAFELPPTPISTSAIRMVAVEAIDDRSPPVHYAFIYTGGFGGHSISFNGREYIDTNLPRANWPYPYQVAAGDSANNSSQFSPESVGSTMIEAPTGVLIGAVTSSSISLTATGSFSNIGLGQTGFYFEVNPAAGTGANQWVPSSTTTVMGLTPGTFYRIRVKARNWQAFETPFTSRVHARTQGGDPHALTPERSAVK